ncbi:hypothetical protein BLOT_007557 [Blomia tropicalis]|nr:hypothetical protein BLOT_007557 [Blomia tropicalis]
MKLFVCLAIVFAACLALTEAYEYVTADDCPGFNTEYRSCKQTTNCNNFKNPYRAEKCVPGCGCKDGYVYQTGLSGEGLNNEYYVVNLPPSTNCKNKDDPPAATSPLLRPGCACKKGYIYEEGSRGDCVKPDDCGKKPKKRRRRIFG